MKYNNTGDNEAMLPVLEGRFMFNINKFYAVKLQLYKVCSLEREKYPAKNWLDSAEFMDNLNNFFF